jgi:hypothetical protein
VTSSNETVLPLDAAKAMSRTTTRPSRVWGRGSARGEANTRRGVVPTRGGTDCTPRLYDVNGTVATLPRQCENPTAGPDRLADG